MAPTQIVGLAVIALVTGQISTLFSIKHAFSSQLRESRTDSAFIEEKVAVLQLQLLEASEERNDAIGELALLIKEKNETANAFGNGQKIFQQQGDGNKNVTFPMTQKRHKLAIAIISSFDWEEKAPFVSFRARRQLHRDTWMNHPAITQSEEVVVYFVIGNQQHRTQGNPSAATHDISELKQEMDHYGDILLLNGSDMHNYGKNNAWYEWAAVNLKSDYHVKLDDESYVVLDRLLSAVDTAPQQKFLGGLGQRMDWKFGTYGTLKDIPWLRGWGYIMSEDLIKGLGKCSSSDGVVQNNGQHEDVYNSVALSVCGLDKNLTFSPGMQVHSLRHVLSLGCPKNAVDGAIVLHGGMRALRGGNPFTKVSAQTFRALHSIYHPQVGDLAPSWTKWEGLRQLYMNDFGACQGDAGQGWTCSYGGWENMTCLPADSR